MKTAGNSGARILDMYKTFVTCVFVHKFQSSSQLFKMERCSSVSTIKEVSNSTGSEFEESMAPARFRDSAFVHDTEAKLEAKMRNSKLENFVVTV